MFNRIKNLQLSIIKQMEMLAAKYPEAVSLASENMYYDWEKEIIVTAGSIEGITAAILAISEPGDEIILPSPSYASHKEVIALAGCRPVFVPLNKAEGWSFELDKFEQAVTEKTRAILFCNPNNPTGTIYGREQLIGLAKLAERHNLIIISDEVYKDFVYAGNEKFFSLAELPELRRQVIRVFSFSKSYAMTGWRVGFIHGDESVISEILKVHDCLVTCAPVISQYGAMGALEMGESDVAFFKKHYHARRDLICSRLDKLNNFLPYIKPNSSYYVFPRIVNHDDSTAFALELLDKVQVVTVPGVAFGPDGEGHIRLSFGRSEEHINLAFDRLEKFFN